MRRDLTAFSPLRSRFIYRDSVTGLADERLSELLRRRAGKTYEFNLDFLDRSLRGHHTWPLTIVKRIGKAPDVMDEISDTRSAGRSHETLEGALDRYFEKNLSKSKVVSVALSGGMDSQLLALFLANRGYEVEAHTLKTDVPGYCEYRHALVFARDHGLRIHSLQCSTLDFVDSLGAFMKVTETPIYNLHAISKLILAREAKNLGVDELVTGDGADQVMRGQTECDLFPLTQKVFTSAGVRLLAPFCSREVLDFTASKGPWAAKEPLRQLAMKLGLRSGPKIACYCPPIPGFESKGQCLLQSLKILRQCFGREGGLACAELPASFGLNS